MKDISIRRTDWRKIREHLHRRLPGIEEEIRTLEKLMGIYEQIKKRCLEQGEDPKADPILKAYFDGKWDLPEFDLEKAIDGLITQRFEATMELRMQIEDINRILEDY